MYARDHTSDLHHLFERARSHAAPATSPPPPKTANESNRVALSTTTAPFVEALRSITSGFEQLQQDANRVVRSALLTMDDIVIGTTSDLEAQVRDAIASGISLGATVSQFLQAVDKAAELEAKVAADADPRDHDVVDGLAAAPMGMSWADRLLKSARAASAAAEHMLLALPSKRFQGRRSSCMQTIEHCKAAGETLQARIVAVKLRLALCEEELERYQKDLFVMGRCNVLSACVTTHLTVPESAWSSSSAVDILRRKEERQRGGGRKGSNADQRHRAFIGERKLIQGKEAAKRVVASFSSMTANVGAKVAAAASHAAAGGGGADDAIHSFLSSTLKTTGPSSNQSELYRPAHTFTFTDDDRKTLAQESIVLEQQLAETSAQSAKEIESSIRELSHLTSILNEQAVLQTEQLTYVAKNTEAAFENVSKASHELQQPRKSSFWQPTRQLIALIWLCIVAMLFAHVMVR